MLVKALHVFNEQFERRRAAVSGAVASTGALFVGRIERLPPPNTRSTW